MGCSVYMVCVYPYPIPLSIKQNPRLFEDLCVDFFFAHILFESGCICMDLVVFYQIGRLKLHLLTQAKQTHVQDE
jgi:hypothetical protein